MIPDPHEVPPTDLTLLGAVLLAKERPGAAAARVACIELLLRAGADGAFWEPNEVDLMPRWTTMYKCAPRNYELRFFTYWDCNSIWKIVPWYSEVEHARLRAAVHMLMAHAASVYLSASQPFPALSVTDQQLVRAVALVDLTSG